MAKQCDICARKSTKDASRSHSNIKTVKRQYINLQTKTVGGRKLTVCTKCIKTIAKNIAIMKAKAAAAPKAKKTVKAKKAVTKKAKKTAKK